MLSREELLKVLVHREDIRQMAIMTQGRRDYWRRAERDAQIEANTAAEVAHEWEMYETHHHLTQEATVSMLAKLCGSSSDNFPATCWNTIHVLRPEFDR